MRLFGAVGATLLSSLLFGLAFPEVSWRPLAAVCLVPFLLALRGVGLGAAALLGALWGVASAAAVGDAMPGMVTTYFLKSRVVGYLFFLGIAVGSAVPYYGSFALVYGPLARRVGPRLRPLAVAAAWTAVELGRGRLLTPTTLAVGNPWALLGYTQVGWPAALQVASLVGIYGVSFALAALNEAIAELVRSARAGAAERRAAWVGLGVAAVPAAAALAFGAVALSRAPAPQPPAPGPLEVALIQANLDLGSSWRPELYGENLDAYLRLSLQAVEAAAPAIVIWPENALSFLLEEEPDYQRALARLTAGADVELIAGGPGLGGGDPPTYFNSVFALGPDGQVHGRYDKRHLLPFTEFFPLPGVAWLRERFARVQVFTHGERTPPLPTRLGPAGVLICNEGMLPEVAAARVRDGATWLVNPSNDSWMATSRWGEMMFDMISVRAVEQRRFLVRASTSGPSGVVDPWGRVQVRTATLAQAVAVGRVAPRSDVTLYARLGDAFAFACLAAVAALLLRRRADDAPTGARAPLH